MRAQEKSLVIQISGTFDIAMTRQHIRKLADEFQWHSTLRLRAIAGLTALAETIYFRDRERSEALDITIMVSSKDKLDLIEYHVDTNFAVILKQYPLARWQLERASDQLEIQNANGVDHLVMCIWMNGKS